MEISAIIGGLTLFFLRLTDVSMGTVRTILIIRGQKIVASLVGFVEVTIWVVAMNQVMGHLDNPWNFIGYCSGFAVGNLVGIMLEERLALGFADIHVISTNKGNKLAQELRKAGYGVTMTTGHGQCGPVVIVKTVVRRRSLPDALKVINSVDPEAFVVSEETRYIYRGYIGERK